MVSNISHIRQRSILVFPGFVIDRLGILVAMKKLLKGSSHPCLALPPGMPLFGKQVAIVV